MVSVALEEEEMTVGPVEFLVGALVIGLIGIVVAYVRHHSQDRP